ncbi:MAG: PilW family protein [Candidatus Zixiibacteriota bacterium]
MRGITLTNRINRNTSALQSESGFTILELLIALFLGGVIALFALKFYVNEHNNYLVQRNVSDMQQNLRAALREVAHSVINGGANLPPEIAAFEVANKNPDSLVIRYAPIGGSVLVGDHTQIKQASPIHVAKGSDLSKFSAGMRVRLWHSGLKTGEWFTITKIATNNGSGWEEIHHQGQTLLFDPEPGDMLLALEEVSYFVDPSDTTNPLFMVQRNGQPAAPYSENVESFDMRFTTTRGDTVSVLTPADTVLSGIISLQARTGDVDYEAMDRNVDGRRRRAQVMEVAIRNNLQ